MLNGTPVRAVKIGEIDHPPAACSDQAFSVLEEWLLPGCRKRESMPDVKVGVAIVQPDIPRIGVTQIAYSVRAGAVFGEGRAEVIQGVRIGIICLQRESRAADLLCLENCTFSAL